MEKKPKEEIQVDELLDVTESSKPKIELDNDQKESLILEIEKRGQRAIDFNQGWRATAEKAYSYYVGIQWQNIQRKSGYSKPVVNVTKDTARRWATFEMGTAPTINILTKDEIEITADAGVKRDSIEYENEVEIAEKILLKCMRENNYSKELLDCSLDKSLMGRGAYIVKRIDKEKKIKFYKISPLKFYPFYKDNRYKELFYMYAETEVNSEVLENKYGIKVKAEKPYNPNVKANAGHDDSESAVLKEYWDDKVYIAIINKEIVEYKKHGYGFCPFEVAQNYTSPSDPMGESDVENIIGRAGSDGLQDQLNMSFANLTDMGNKMVVTKTLVKNPGQMKVDDLKHEGPEVAVIGSQSEVTQLYPQTNSQILENTLNIVKREIEDQTSITELMKGRFSGSIGTGVFLTGLSQGMKNLAEMKVVNHSLALASLFNKVLQLYRTSGWVEETTGKKYSELLKQKEYFIDIIYPSNSIQDIQVIVTSMSNLVDRKMISRLDALKILQTVFPMLRSPQDLLERVKEEIGDPRMNVDIMIQMAANQDFTRDPRMVEEDALNENSQMALGREQEVTEETDLENELHIRIHEEFSLSGPGKQMKANAKDIFRKHLATHRQKLAATRAGQTQQAGANEPQPEGPQLGQNQNQGGFPQTPQAPTNPGSPRAPQTANQ